MTACKAFICGCAGAALTAAETDFLDRERPWGLILFKRNIVEPAQVGDLVACFRDRVGRRDAPVLVDQEGGRVQRFGPPNWPEYPSAGRLAALPGGVSARADAVRLASRLMAEDLADLGVDIDCMPVLDTPSTDAHSVIGDRAYSDDPVAVAILAQAAIEGLLSGRVLPVVKHTPGHGRARADSHKELPVVTASLAELDRIDFAPFKALAKAPLAMTAHVLYEAIDPLRPGSLSPIVVQQIIREKIGFDGLLMTDDLSMHALKGEFDDRARRAFDAGVDVVLHCNGKLDEASAVAAGSPVLEGAAFRRSQSALDLIAGERAPFDRVAGLSRLRALLEGAVTSLGDIGC